MAFRQLRKVTARAMSGIVRTCLSARATHIGAKVAMAFMARVATARQYQSSVR